MFAKILQKTNFEQKSTWLILLVLCLVTRLLGAIFYIEDIDSLRFALAVYNYDLYDLQPHFPGYFFYFMLIKPIFWLTQSVGISFALMGAIATWVIIFYSYKLYALILQQKLSKQTYLLGVLLLFNPLLFLMSTRYMPDIGGLALLIMGTYYLLHAIQYKAIKSALLHVIIIGLECGLRLSYLPFWFPSIVLTVFFYWQIPLLLGAGSFAILFWLLPMIVDTGWSRLLEVCQQHVVGHFTEWGGTVMSNDHSYLGRWVAMLESIWADGLGGFWVNRHWLTALWALVLLFLLMNSLKIIHSQWKNYSHRNTTQQHCYLLGSCLLVYSIWAYFFQNIVYKPRHIMPLLPFLTMLIAFGGNQLLKSPSAYFKLLMPLMLSIGIFITCILGIQHKTPSSIAQIKNFIIEQSRQQPVLILSPPLMNFYFRKHSALQTNTISCISLDEFNLNVLESKDSDLVIFSVQNIDHIMKQNGVEQQFYHNPYVNRLWSQLSLYSYKSNQ